MNRDNYGRCPICNKEYLYKKRGSPRKYCSHRCRQRAYRMRQLFLEHADFVQLVREQDGIA